MIPNPQSAKFLGDTARKAKEGPGIGLCGNVDYLDTDARPESSNPIMLNCVKPMVSRTPSVARQGPFH